MNLVTVLDCLRCGSELRARDYHNGVAIDGHCEKCRKVIADQAHRDELAEQIQQANARAGK